MASAPQFGCFSCFQSYETQQVSYRALADSSVNSNNNVNVYIRDSSKLFAAYQNAHNEHVLQVTAGNSLRRHYNRQLQPKIITVSSLAI